MVVLEQERLLSVGVLRMAHQQRRARRRSGSWWGVRRRDPVGRLGHVPRDRGRGGGPRDQRRALAVAAGLGPFGVVDLVAPGPGPGTVHVAGWAIDPDTPAPATVQVRIDDGPPVPLVADARRADVAAVHPWAGPDHGFDGTVSGVDPGRRAVCIEALDAPTPIAAPARLACHLIIVAG
jgi:hypothetical protein